MSGKDWRAVLLHNSEQARKGGFNTRPFLCILICLFRHARPNETR